MKNMIIRLKNIIKVSPKQKMAYVILLAIWLMVITYCDMSDYAAYFADYYRLIRSGNAILSRDYEIGFYYSMRLFALFHLPFKVFFAFYMSIELYLLWRFIRNNTKHRASLLILCLLFPFIFYIQQIRSSMSVMIILNGIELLEPPQTRKKTLKYILICIIASLFHKTSLFYLVFILARYMNKNSIRRIVLLLNFVVPIGLYFFYSRIVAGLKIIFHDFWMIDYYFQRTFTPQKYTFFIAGMYFIWFCVLVYMDSKRRSRTDTDKYKFYYKLSLLVCSLALLGYFTVLADRIVCMVTPILYVTIDINAKPEISRIKKKITKIACFIFALVYLIFFIGPWNPQSNNRFIYEMWRQHPKKGSVTHMGDKL